MFLEFNNKHELENWLSSKKIDTSKWGTGDSKTISNLWTEIIDKETKIQDNPPLRVVSGVVMVIIKKKDKILIEYEQEFKDGRKRKRDNPPLDKIKFKESYFDAAVRCLQEELGINSENINILRHTHKKEQKISESPSYPELNTKYYFHIVEAKVKGLPKEDFQTFESGKSDTIKIHYWTWKNNKHRGSLK